MRNLGMEVACLKRLGEAEVLLSEALSGCWRVLGSEHPYTKDAYSALMHVLDVQGKARDARDVKAQYGVGM
jgi:DNA-binding SARP family transcriptional activator